MMESQIKNSTHEELLTEITKLKHDGYRLLAITCTRSDGFELTYSFDRENGDDFLHVRLKTDAETPVESISHIFDCSFLYENEIRELFGVNIVHISVDFKDNLYKIAEKIPFSKSEEGK